MQLASSWHSYIAQWFVVITAGCSLV